MLITQILCIQHHVFFEQLDYLKHLKEMKESPDVSGLKEVTFAIAEALEKHSAVEEKFLYPKLKAAFENKLGPVGVMEQEHREIHHILESLKQTNDPQKIQVETSRFIIYLRDHLAKEENFLFTLAEQFLGKDKLEEAAREAGFSNHKGEMLVHY